MRYLSLTLAVLLAACGGNGERPNINIGAPAPKFEAHYLNDQQASFPEAFTQKPLVIRFWADYCKYCEGEMKAIERVYLRHKEEGLIILAINTGQDKATALAFMDKLGVSYPALLDESSQIGKQFGVVALPTTFFVDRKGSIQAKIVGESDETTFERHAVSLLK